MKKDEEYTAQVQVAAVEGELCSSILIHIPSGELENSLVLIKRKKNVFIKEKRSFLSRVKHVSGQRGFYKYNFLLQSDNHRNRGWFWLKKYLLKHIIHAYVCMCVYVCTHKQYDIHMQCTDTYTQNPKKLHFSKKFSD